LRFVFLAQRVMSGRDGAGFIARTLARPATLATWWIAATGTKRVELGLLDHL
jgi:hypothetical protein